LYLCIDDEEMEETKKRYKFPTRKKFWWLF